VASIRTAWNPCGSSILTGNPCLSIRVGLTGHNYWEAPLSTTSNDGVINSGSGTVNMTGCAVGAGATVVINKTKDAKPK
jgi:hypothetical protein